MPVLPGIEAFADDLTRTRRTIHANPELGFQEVATAALIADELRSYGVDEIHAGVASKNPGVFHGCGHDSHIAMLLGAARYLAATRDFAGRAVLIFQPAEEGLGGARAMIAEGLFERFSCDEVYALHNSPTAPPNQFGVKPARRRRAPASSTSGWLGGEGVIPASVMWS